MRMGKILFYIGCLLSGIMLLNGGETEMEKNSALPMMQEDIKYSFQPRGGAVVDSVLASVNGEAICLSDVYAESRSEESKIYMTCPPGQVMEEIKRIRQITLDDLIGRRLILAEYNKKPFPIKLQHIEDIVNDFMREIGCSTRAELEHKLSESGVSMEKMRQRARERIIIEAMLGQQMYLSSNVTPRMINEEFNRLTGKYDEASQVNLKLIMLDKSDVKFSLNNAVVLEELAENPDSFDELVGKYSIGPGNNNNGKLGWVKVPDLRVDFKAAIGEVDAGKKGFCFGPIYDGTMVYYLKVEDFRPGKKVEPAELRSMIKRKLELKFRSEALDKYVKKLRSRSVIRYF